MTSRCLKQARFTEISSVRNSCCPDHPSFDFEKFYDLLNARGQVIYPGKVSNADCFRIGNIGRLFTADVKVLLSAIREVLVEMGMSVDMLAGD